MDANAFKTFFSRIVALIMTLAAALSGGRIDKVQLRLLEPVTAESGEIRFEIRNYSGEILRYGKAFTLEKEVDGEWTDNWTGHGEIIVIVPKILIEQQPASVSTETVSFGSILVIDENDGGEDLPVSSEIEFGAGRYRLTKSFTGASGREYSAKLEFEIKN